jgi:hypothetical protein
MKTTRRKKVLRLETSSTERSRKDEHIRRSRLIPARTSVSQEGTISSFANACVSRRTWHVQSRVAFFADACYDVEIVADRIPYLFITFLFSCTVERLLHSCTGQTMIGKCVSRSIWPYWLAKEPTCYPYHRICWHLPAW